MDAESRGGKLPSTRESCAVNRWHVPP